jgi:hypothetical protein
METNDITKQTTLDEIQEEIDKQITKYVQLSSEEAQVLEFTGKTWLRQHEFKDKAGNASPATLVDFEISEKLADGTNRILSRNVGNSDVPKIVRYLKEGKLKLMLSKDKSNKVSVAPVKS